MLGENIVQEQENKCNELLVNNLWILLVSTFCDMAKSKLSNFVIMVIENI